MEINPYLLNLENNIDAKFRQLKQDIRQIRERINLDLSVAIGKYISVLEKWESMRILNGLRQKYHIQLSLKNTNLYEHAEKNANNNLINIKSIIYKHIEKLKRKS